jgi:hypothetical protein
MFLLVPQVKLRKRLDVARAAKRWSAQLPALIEQQRAGDPREPEQALSGFGSTYCQHPVEDEVYLEEGDAPARELASTSSSSRSGRARS